MHHLEPFYNWRDYYIAAEDELSPFYGRTYSEFQFSDKIYNHYIHPQWDDFGSETLFIKILYANYESGFGVIEFIGEWNDAITNDIMILKRDILEPLMQEGIHQFVFIGENVLNFHGEDTDYYEELYEELLDEAGYVILVNFQQHVVEEMQQYNLHEYLIIQPLFHDMSWRKLKPEAMRKLIQNIMMQAIDAPQ